MFDPPAVWNILRVLCFSGVVIWVIMTLACFVKAARRSVLTSGQP
jgi:hypothetical protein